MLGDKFNFGNLMKNAKKMQEMMEKAQGELAKVEVKGEAGAGVVKITMNARHYVKAVNIDSDILKESKDVLEELIAAAINDASQKVEEVTKSKMMDAGQIFTAVSEVEDDQDKDKDKE